MHWVLKVDETIQVGEYDPAFINPHRCNEELVITLCWKTWKERSLRWAFTMNLHMILKMEDWWDRATYNEALEKRMQGMY